MKKLYLFFDHKFCQDANGYFFSKQNYNYHFLKKRYLSIFDEVCIVARVKPEIMDNPNNLAACGEGVSIVNLGDWHGFGFFKKFLSIAKVAFDRSKESNASFILVVPGVVGALSSCVLLFMRRKYAVEVVGDSYDLINVKSKLYFHKVILKKCVFWVQKKTCEKASASAYVTKYTLQKRYPPFKNSYSTYYSSIQLDDCSLGSISTRKHFGSLKLLCIGTFDHEYKGQDILVHALSSIKEKEVDFSCTFIGGGRLQNNIEALAKELNVYESCEFVGWIKERARIIEFLDECDFLVLSSRQEGLPRVIIEAMARGKICIASDVGGVNELIDSRFIFDVGDFGGLASLLEMCNLMGGVEYEGFSNFNFERSKDYCIKKLSKRRNDFYSIVSELNE